MTTALEALKKERGALSAERVQLAGKVVALKETIAAMETVEWTAAKDLPTVEGQAPRIDLDRMLAREEIQDKPDPLQMPLLSQEELAQLKEAAEGLPPDQSVLLKRDLEDVVRDPDWNPSGRELDAEGKARLAKLLSDYRYFSRVAPLETVKRFIHPELGRLREAGAFVTYGKGERPPRIEGAIYKHGEPSEEPGRRRLYYFLADDHPDLYHFRQVLKERCLQASVDVFRLLNGSG